jgi:protein-L-isoaspartate(D-aspartate) O-methyltransferase
MSPPIFRPRTTKEMVADLAERGIRNPDVLRAFEAVPRQAFVLPAYLDQAFADCPLPIACSQTISQPFMVAVMTELLGLCPGDKTLEIGTGSGYQAAILCELGMGEVYSVEIIPDLAEAAAARLNELGYSRVHVKQSDGFHGWPEQAPYQGIVVTAAAEKVPPPLSAQLAEAGRLVIPLGAPHHFQELWVFTKRGERLDGEPWGGVAFVPFTRYH